MAKNAYRDKLKRRLGIREDENQFDTDIDDFTYEAVANLYPIVQVELPTETYTLPAGENEISLKHEDLSGDIETVRRLEIYSDENDTWNPTDEYTQHDNFIYLYEGFSSGKQIRLHGLGRYNLSNLPKEFEQVVLNWAMSEFYSLLVGDKRKYTIYTQTTGSRSVDNLRDLSDYYLDRGNQLLADRATVRGV